MALIFRGKSTCALCDLVIETGDEIMATSGVPVSASDPLAAFYDAGMHHACFMGWRLRESFIRKFNDYFEQHYRGMRFMREDGSIEEREPHAGRTS
jgi:hypothetical protein